MLQLPRTQEYSELGNNLCRDAINASVQSSNKVKIVEEYTY